MRRIIAFYCFILLPWLAHAQTVTQTGTGLSCADAFAFSNNLYCSPNGQYNNSDAAQGGITWFKFYAVNSVVTVTVSGEGTGGTLRAPTVTIYSDCGVTVVPSISSITANINTTHAEGLNSATYYVAVSGANKGTFNFCLNVYEPSRVAGTDCSTAQTLYNLNDLKVARLNGAGSNSNESIGSCLGGNETNSMWYKFIAANNGSLVFTLTPDLPSDDLDFILYDLDVTGSCGNVNPAHVKRCAAGSGITCTVDRYYKTGLSSASVDDGEDSGCRIGQDGKVRAIDLVKGHTYGLLVNNATSDNGYTLKFNDATTGAPSTATFLPAVVGIDTPVPPCNSAPVYVFYNYLTVTNKFAWDFGAGATIVSANALNEFSVTYDTPGPRTVTLTIYSPGPLTSQITLNAIVAPPSISISAISDKSLYCTGDVVTLSTPQVNNNSYLWTGPEGFTATGSTIKIPVTAGYVAGSSYTVSATDGLCPAGTATVTPNVSLSPVANFTASPSINTTAQAPATINFTNTSSPNADSFSWDFGDSEISTDINPTHIYRKSGTYHVKLTAYNAAGCFDSVIEGALTVKNANVIFLYNTFTPNGDNINDKFVVSITNTATFHIQIFNRYGKMVFETRDQSVNWDGTYNGGIVPVGTYYYVIDALGLDGNAIKEGGHVSVIR